MTSVERLRPGGRSARIQAAVHQAVKELCAEMDRAELTIPMIAARAGVTPSTLYRRWGELAELLSDVAVERLRPMSDPADTGTVLGDLKAWTEQYMEEMSSPVGRDMIRDVYFTGQRNIATCCNFTFEQLQVIADRAAARGERGFDVAEAVDHVVAPILYHILFTGRPLTVAYCDRLVERVLGAGD